MARHELAGKPVVINAARRGARVSVPGCVRPSRDVPDDSYGYWNHQGDSVSRCVLPGGELPGLLALPSWTE
jgi:hypothetical protein